MRPLQLEQLRLVMDSGNSGSVISKGQLDQPRCISDCCNLGSVVSKGQL